MSIILDLIEQPLLWTQDYTYKHKKQIWERDHSVWPVGETKDLLHLASFDIVCIVCLFYIILFNYLYFKSVDGVVWVRNEVTNIIM